MADNQIKELYPGLVRVWRIGYVVLSIAIVAIFISIVVLLEITRQLALVVHYSFASPFLFSVLILLFIQGVLVGMWLSMQVIFGCTHPTHKPYYWRWVLLGFTVMWFMTLTIFQFTNMMGYFRVLPVYFPLLVFLNELILVNITSLIMVFYFAAMSVVMWVKWLKPLTRE